MSNYRHARGFIVDLFLLISGHENLAEPTTAIDLVSDVSVTCKYVLLSAHSSSLAPQLQGLSIVSTVSAAEDLLYLSCDWPKFNVLCLCVINV